MAIYDFYLKSIPFAPDKTKTILIVDPDAVLAGAITPQGFQPVPRGHGQVFERDRCVQDCQFPECAPSQSAGEPSISPQSPQLFRFLSRKLEIIP